MKYYRNEVISAVHFFEESFEIENCAFYNCTFKEIIALKEIKNCIFINCNLSPIYIGHLYFKDCFFEHISIRAKSLTNIKFDNCNFYDCNLSFVKMLDLDFKNSTFEDVSFEDVIIENCVLPPEEKNRTGVILVEPMIGWKKCKDGVLVKLEIPKGAIVYSANNSKCRTNRAKVIDIDDEDRAFSIFKYFSYYKGDEINIKNFNLNPSTECGTGIHFYRTKEEAMRFLP